MQPVSATGAKFEVSTNAIYPVWSAKGQELIWAGEGFHSVRVATAGAFAFDNAVALPVNVWVKGPSVARSYDILPDGRFVGFVQPVSDAAKTPATPRFRVVLNWFEELKAKPLQN